MAETTCSKCKGAGSVGVIDAGRGPDDAEVVDASCPDCGGTGAVLSASSLTEPVPELSTVLQEESNQLPDSLWRIRSLMRMAADTIARSTPSTSADQLPEGSAQLSTFHRITALESQAGQDGDWETAFTKMAQRCNTLSKVIDDKDKAARSSSSFTEPTREEIATYRDTFRAELDKRMDTNHPSASPSTEAHAVALRQFVKARAALSAIGEQEVGLEQYAQLRNALTEIKEELEPEHLAGADDQHIGTHIEHAFMVAEKALQETPDSWLAKSKTGSAPAPSDAATS